MGLGLGQDGDQLYTKDAFTEEYPYEEYKQEMTERLFAQTERLRTRLQV